MIIFDNKEEALKRFHDGMTKGILLETLIERLENGKYKLLIRVYETSDKLTSSIFVNEISEDKYLIREVKTVGSNVFYDDNIDNINRVATEKYEEYFDSFEEAYDKLIKLLKKIEENRKKVREAKKEYYKWVVI
jgi:hypothetical protein